MRFRGDARIVKRSLGNTLGVLAGGLLATLLLLFFTGNATLYPVAATAAFGIGVFLWTSRHQARPGPERHAIAADPQGLHVDGELVLPHARIGRVHVAEVQDGHAVHVDGRRLGRSYSIVFDDEEKAEELHDALLVGPAAAVARFKALPPWAKHLRWLAVVLTASPWIVVQVLRFAPRFIWPFVLLGYAVLALPLVLSQRIEVGEDGIFLRWAGNKRFLAFASMRAVTKTNTGAELELRDGRRIALQLTYKDAPDNRETVRLVERIEQGLAALEARTHDAGADESLLARGERDLATWLRDMRALGAGDVGGYRVNAIPEDRLWTVIENPAADASAREGAALALHARLDDAGRDKLRELARSTASPRLRIALDGVAKETDEAKLRIALDAAELEEAEPPSEDALEARRAKGV